MVCCTEIFLYLICSNCSSILPSQLLFHHFDLIFQVYANPETSANYGPEPAAPKEGEESDGVKGHWDQRLNSFQKLIFIKSFKEEKVGS